MADPKPDESCSAYGNAIKIAELEKRLDIYIEYQREAVKLASDNLATRLEHSNGLISQMKEQSISTISRAESMLLIKNVEERISALNEQLARMAGMDIRIGIIASIIGSIAGFFLAYLFRRMSW